MNEKISEQSGWQITGLAQGQVHYAEQEIAKMFTFTFPALKSVGPMLPAYHPRCSLSVKLSSINEDRMLVVATHTSHINRTEPLTEGLAL